MLSADDAPAHSLALSRCWPISLKFVSKLDHSSRKTPFAHYVLIRPVQYSDKCCFRMNWKCVRNIQCVHKNTPNETERERAPQIYRRSSPSFTLDDGGRERERESFIWCWFSCKLAIRYIYAACNAAIATNTSPSRIDQICIDKHKVSIN